MLGVPAHAGTTETLKGSQRTSAPRQGGMWHLEFPEMKAEVVVVAVVTLHMCVCVSGGPKKGFLIDVCLFR